MNLPEVRAALRIARRDARRAKGRSALVIAMIALPVLGLTAADVLARTAELSPAEQATREMGAADATLIDSGFAAIEQRPGGGWHPSSRGEDRRAALSRAEIAAALPAGTRILPDHRRPAGILSNGELSTRTGIRLLDYADPLAAGIYDQLTGRAPQQEGEVALTTALADRLDAEPGDTLTRARTGRTVTVVGIVADTSDTGALTVLPAPSSLPPTTARSASEPDTSLVSAGPSSRRYLLDLPGALRWADIERANAAGLFVEPRGPVPDAPPVPDLGGGQDTELIASGVLLAGMALLEVVLLAGPAFAVGAKRQRQELALLAATGADRRQVRDVVLGQGVVLGVTGAVLGALGGIGLAAAVVPFLHHWSVTPPGPFDVRPLEIAGVMAVGVGTAVLAAVVPARAAARADVVASLTGRRGTVRSSRRTPVLGLLAAVLGGVLALFGATHRSVPVILAGSIVAELGLVACTPALVGMAGRLGRPLPALPRLALRDAARNRARTAPAVSAILAAVAGSVAVGVYVSSMDAYDRANYTPMSRPGQVSVQLGDDHAVESLPRIREVLGAGLPAEEIAVAYDLVDEDTGRGASTELKVPESARCPRFAPGDERLSEAERERLSADPRCQARPKKSLLFGDPIGGVALLRATTDGRHPAAAAVLSHGGVVVTNPRYVVDGHVTVLVHRPGEPEPVSLRLPAMVVHSDSSTDEPIPTAILPRALAGQIGLSTRPARLLVDTSRAPTTEEADRVREGLADLGVWPYLSVERGYQSDYTIGLIALVLGAAVITLGASGIATGLAAADGRSDLATLAAVGATPRMRRVLAGAQSGVTAGIGALLGVAAGLVPAVGLIRALNQTDGRAAWIGGDSHPLVIPWAEIGITALAVPLLAALLAFVLTRSRLPLVRRVA